MWMLPKQPSLRSHEDQSQTRNAQMAKTVVQCQQRSSSSRHRLRRTPRCSHGLSRCSSMGRLLGNSSRSRSLLIEHLNSSKDIRNLTHSNLPSKHHSRRPNYLSINCQIRLIPISSACTRKRIRTDRITIASILIQERITHNPTTSDHSRQATTFLPSSKSQTRFSWT